VIDWLLLPLIVHVLLIAIAYKLQRSMFAIFFTGTVVNSMFVLSLLTHHDGWSYAAAIIVPSISIFTGHLPKDLVALIPFICAGNSALIYLYSGSEELSVFDRVVLPSVLKAGIIGSGGFLLLALHKLHETPKRRLVVVVVAQLITSLGGIILGEYIAFSLLGLTI
jgi:hypothetical protein